MFTAQGARPSRWTSAVACAGMLLGSVVATGAQAEVKSTGSPAKEIDFSAANLPPATVEVNLSQEIFADLFGLTDAAVAGVIQSLSQENEGHESQATQLAADKLSAAHEIIQLTREVVHEVRLRIYDDLPNEAGKPSELTGQFDQQLREGGWDNVITVRDGDELVRVSLQRVEGSILGAFVTVVDGNDAVLANVECDISPEKVKQLSALVTKIGLENGLKEAIEQKLLRVPRR